MVKEMDIFNKKKHIIELYHGSKDIIKNPKYGKGNKYNDYGMGFYCTPHINLAKEWSVNRDRDGYANKYELDLSGLKVLDLQEMNILYWITILLENRDLHETDMFLDGGYEYLVERYHIDLKEYDVVIGYRADDAYFSYMRRFMSSALPVEQLAKILKYGDLGLQYVLISEKSFTRLKFLNAIHVPKSVYYHKKQERDTKARMDYKTLKVDPGGTFLLNLIQSDLRGE